MGSETVTATPPGTTPEAEGIKPPSGEGGTPGKEGQVSSEEKLYTQKQVDSLIHAARSEAGRELADVRKRLELLEGEKASVNSQLEESNNEITALEKKLEDMSSDDPNKFEVTKELRLAREERRKLRAKETELTSRENALKPREEKVSAFEVDILCEEIADDEVYEGADPKKLREICKTTGVKTEEAVRKIADTLWIKKPQSMTPSQPQQPIQAYPGYTSGGTGGREPTLEELRNSSPEETERKIKSGEWKVRGWVTKK